ncbi:MAG: DUF3310 domain-containing protein [Alphaproteobacteria bacterium]|nr:DUF3310 domain-containing protein [Alphaproteobacteria bacterium]
MKSIDYKYDESRLLREIEAYIDATYGEHYSQNKFQATEFIIDSGHGEGFTLGNVMKYAQRYGKKGGRNRKDLLKVIHYAIMMLYIHDTYYGDVKDEVRREDAGSLEKLFGDQYGNLFSTRQNSSGNQPIKNLHWQGADTTGD